MEIRSLLPYKTDLEKVSLAFREMLLDLKQRGLSFAPKLATGNGGLGFWAALGEVFPETRWQRCWVLKTVNILDKMPKST